MLEAKDRPLSSRVCILNGETPSVSARLSGEALSGWEKAFLEKSLLQAGLDPGGVRLVVFNEKDLQLGVSLSKQVTGADVLVPMGGKALKYVTGLTSIDKWHLSPVKAKPEFGDIWCIPTFHPGRISREFGSQLYVLKALIRAKEIAKDNGRWDIPKENFHLNPPFDDTIDILKSLEGKPILANDVETGNGVINTVGFAWSHEDAIAIQTLPERFSAEKFKVLWEHIAKLLEDPAVGKLYQNNIYEALYYSLYGIRVRNTFHDTMWAQRVLYPEFPVGLDNVGRLYTRRPYWKDIGKDYKGEGGKRDWGAIKDWVQHFRYNCHDTTGTFEAYLNQSKDIQDRGLGDFFYGYVMELAQPIVEMCSRGLPINKETQQRLHEDTKKRIEEMQGQLTKDINPKSWKQKQDLLLSKGYKLPTKRNSKGQQATSTDELALKKLRLKHPGDRDLELLLGLAKANKALGSYIDVRCSSDDKMRFMMNGTGTETLRFSSSKDPWDHGLNAQTLPKAYKKMFDAPEGKTWLQVDLMQAESRFVAYDSCDPDLIEMLENPDKDIHSYVAAAIFEVTEEQVVQEKNNGDPSKRQLGKKTGHGANYDMGVNTFMESCLKEMDLVLTRKFATKVLETYHQLFPGIRRWHQKIRDTLYSQRRLVNPLGYERYFYGRMDPNTFREAYAFKPQSTIPMITNHLMLYLVGERESGHIDFDLHLQVHDSLLFAVRPDHLGPLARACRDTDAWHPDITLSAGKLIIPTDVEIGNNLGKLKEWGGA